MGQIISTVGDIRDFIRPLTDECKITPLDFTFHLEDGEGMVRAKIVLPARCQGPKREMNVSRHILE
jgi:hypothetical protein